MALLVSHLFPHSCSLPMKVRTELLKTCNLLFSTLEPDFLWEYLADTYEKVLWPSDVRQSNDLSMSEFCDIVSMLLSIVSLVCISDISNISGIFIGSKSSLKCFIM